MLSFIEILKAILFGIVEGITEWLPVSSTGHMILLNEFVHMNVSEEFWDMFLVVIQLGAILAVVLLFWKQIWPFNFTGRFKTNGIVKKDIMKMWFKIIVACIPAAVVGLLFDDILEKYLYNPITVAHTHIAVREVDTVENISVFEIFLQLSDCHNRTVFFRLLSRSAQMRDDDAARLSCRDRIREIRNVAADFSGGNPV